MISRGPHRLNRTELVHRMVQLRTLDGLDSSGSGSGGSRAAHRAHHAASSVELLMPDEVSAEPNCGMCVFSSYRC